MHETPDLCALPASDGTPCGLDILATCTGCGRGYCWGHTRNDREYRCSECTDALADRAAAHGVALAAALRDAGVEPGRGTTPTGWFGRLLGPAALWPTGIGSSPETSVHLRTDGVWAWPDGRPVGRLVTEDMARRAADLTVDQVRGLAGGWGEPGSTGR